MNLRKNTGGCMNQDFNITFTFVFYKYHLLTIECQQILIMRIFRLVWIAKM